MHLASALSKLKQMKLDHLHNQKFLNNCCFMSNYDLRNVNIPTEGLGDVNHPFKETILSSKLQEKAKELKVTKRRFKDYLIVNKISYSNFTTKFPDPGFIGPWS